MTLPQKRHAPATNPSLPASQHSLSHTATKRNQKSLRQEPASKQKEPEITLTTIRVVEGDSYTGQHH